MRSFKPEMRARGKSDGGKLLPVAPSAAQMRRGNNDQGARMRAGIARTLVLMTVALLLAACAIGDSGQRRRERLVRDLADDAAAFNEAYAQAMTGQLLLNILRARDRLPTQYLAMSSIQDAPTITTSHCATSYWKVAVTLFEPR